MNLGEFNEQLLLSVRATLGWSVTALALLAGLVLWLLTLRRLAAGRARGAQPPPAVGDVAQPPPAVGDVTQPPPAVGDEEPAQARAPVPHTSSPAVAPVVPTRAHLGSAFFAAGAALLLLAVAIPLFVFAEGKGPRDYSVTLGLFAAILFCVGLYHGLVVHRRRGLLWPLHVGYWPFFLSSLLAVPFAFPLWLWALVWVCWTLLWLLGIPAALLARWLRRRTRWAMLAATAGMLLLLLLCGRSVAAAVWLAQPEPWKFREIEPFPVAFAGEAGLRDGVRLLNLLGWGNPATIRALKGCGWRAVLAHIALLAGNPDEYLRETAASELGRLGDPRAIEPLIRAFENDESIYVRGFAPDSLRKLTGEEIGDDAAAWRQWWEKNRERFLEGAGRATATPSPQ